jgi:two-component system CheB/CheR fusion protein
VADVLQSRLRRFFVKVDGGYQVVKSIRERCVFARHNLLSDPPFSRIDLVSCRNVLIYFRNQYQRQAFEAFHFALRPGGFLLLGRSETIGSSELFAPVDSRHHIYRTKPDSSHPNVVLLRRDGARRSIDSGTAQVSAHNDALANLQRETERILIERYAPPGIIVNEQFDVVHFRGSTGVFLEPPPGQATLGAIRMAREDFRLLLQSSLFEARKRNKVVRKEGLSVQHHGNTVDFALTVSPIPDNGSERYFLVTFEGNQPQHDPGPLPQRGHAKRSTPAQQEVKALSEELASTKRQLQAIIEELETTNEEMKAANEEVLSSNEELLSMNEELETAKEELQSANEELTTVNDELQNRNNEIGLVAADLSNLLTSIDLPILMLSRDLRIRRYTPGATKVFNIIPADVGRPLTDINLNINVPDFETLLLDVMDSGKMMEREVQDRSGHWYSLRIEPFKTLENRIDGAVMLLIDLLRALSTQPEGNA